MSELPRIFAALSDPTRLAIVERLMRDGELPVATLREESEISAPAISRHLNVLIRTGLVRKRARAQQRLYSVVPETIRAVSSWTLDHRTFWEASLDRLEAELHKEMSRK